MYFNQFSLEGTPICNSSSVCSFYLPSVLTLKLVLFLFVPCCFVLFHVIMAWRCKKDTVVGTEGVSLSYSQSEMRVLEAAIKECGMSYTDLIQAARADTGKMAILSDANATGLGKVVQTSSTKGFIERWREPVKSVVHVQQGLGHQKLLDDRLCHQTSIEHTPVALFEKNRKKSGKNGQAAFVSADVCALQLGFTSHLSAYTNQVACVMLLDGNRQNNAQALLGMGMLPLYKATSHALFFPKLNIDYDDENFLSRIQLLTTFSEDVKGNGSAALSYSTLSIVRHNKVDPHWLPDPLPWKEIEKRYPVGVKGLKDFQPTAISSLPPAKITRTASYMPLTRSSSISSTVLNWRGDDMSVSMQNTLPRNSISYDNLSYGSGGDVGTEITAPACKHGKPNCPCRQHGGKAVASGGLGEHNEELVPIAGIGAEATLIGPKDPPFTQDWVYVGTGSYAMPTITNAGTRVANVSVSMDLFGDTPEARYLDHFPYLDIEVKVRIVASASIYTKGLLWICYDPCNVLDAGCTRETALLLEGNWFIPGKHDSAELVITDLSTPAGHSIMGFTINGAISVVLVDRIQNLEAPYFGFDLERYVRVKGFMPRLVKRPGNRANYLPLRQVVQRFDVTSVSPRGQAYLIPMDPMTPARVGANVYPSCSSTVFEMHSYWQGTLVVEILFSMAAACGGKVEVAFAYSPIDNQPVDDYRKFGSTILDLRTHRICHVEVPSQSYHGWNLAGRGTLFNNKEGNYSDVQLNLALLFSTPLPLTDTTHSATVYVRLLGIKEPEFELPVAAFNRLGLAFPLPAMAVEAAGPNVIKDMVLFKEPTCMVVPSYFPVGHRHRIASIWAWAVRGLMFIPCTPACHVPNFVAPFEGRAEEVNYLAHRSQESAMWRGTLKYYVSVVRNSSNGPITPLVMKIFPCHCPFDAPTLCQDADNEIAIPPAFGDFDMSVNLTPTLVYTCTTPQNRWCNTFFEQGPDYSVQAVPVWLGIQFPQVVVGECNIARIELFVEADIEYFHPKGGFPLVIEDGVEVAQAGNVFNFPFL